MGIRIGSGRGGIGFGLILAEGEEVANGADVDVSLGEGDFNICFAKRLVNFHMHFVHELGPTVAVGDEDAEFEIERAFAETSEDGLRFGIVENERRVFGDLE